MARPKGMSQSWTNEKRDCGSSRCFSVVSYAEPKMNLTTQMAKCIGSAHLRLIVWTSSNYVWKSKDYIQTYIDVLLYHNAK